MLNPVEITVVIPVFNPCLADFDAMLISLERQTCKNFEVLFVNDGGSADFVSRISNFKCPYRLIDLKVNSGIANALNIGLDNCRTKYIARMDVDDICHPERFEAQYLHMERFPNVDLVFSNIVKFEDLAPRFDGRDVFEITSLTEPVPELLFRNILPHPTAFFRTNSLGNFYYDISLRKSQDYDLWMRLLLEGKTICVLPEVLLGYRIRHGGNSSKQQSDAFHAIRKRRAPLLAAKIYSNELAEELNLLFNKKAVRLHAVAVFRRHNLPLRYLFKEWVKNFAS